MAIGDELRKLEALHQSGALNDDEFALAKAKALAGDIDAAPDPRIQDTASAPRSGSAAMNPEEQDRQTKQWGLWLHLSMLAGFVVPFGGLVVPIVIWQLKKAELPGLDAHGKNAVNWIISQIIYLAVSIVLTFVLIGIPLLIAIGVCGVVFPIIAAIKANEGKVWPYPLTITFLK